MNNDKNHRLDAREFFGRGILNNTAEYVGEFFDKGNIAVLAAPAVAEVADTAVKSLIASGYIVRQYIADEKCLKLENVPECVRFYLGVGGGRIADITRLAAARAGARYGIIATSPATESYLADTAYPNFTEELFCGAPEFVIADFDVLDNAPSRLAAAGYGRIIAQLPTIFDVEFSNMIFSKQYDAEALSDLQQCLHRFELNKHQNGFNERLFTALMQIARLRADLEIKNTAVDCYARVLSENVGRLEGETSFLASYVVLNTYRLFLSKEGVDTLLPADVVKTLKLLEKMRVINYNKYVSNMYAGGVADYLRQGFILNEYRRELCGRVENLDLTEISRFFRRIYDDAGFWLKSYASGAELLRYLSLSAEVSDDCLMKYLKRLGFLERFI